MAQPSLVHPLLRCDLNLGTPVLFHVLPNSQNKHGRVFVDQLNDGANRLNAEVRRLRDLDHTQVLFLVVPVSLTRGHL